MASSSETQWAFIDKENPPARGAFILVEGLDRAGKTTQVKRLCDRLYSRGHNVKSIRFPDRTSTIGKLIDDYLQSNVEMEDHVIHLLFSANRWEKAKWIEDTIAAGYNIVCDRYYYSGIVYSVAKQNPALSLEWAKSPDIGLPRPDLTIFLDLEANEAERRGGYGEEKYEKKEMQERVRKLFLHLLKLEKGEASIEVVDAGATIDEVAERIFQKVEPAVIAVMNGELGTEMRRLQSQDTTDRQHQS